MVTKTGIYLDHNATTPMLPGVVGHMAQFYHLPLNPSSVHSMGRDAKSIITDARRSIALLLGIDGDKNYQIIFTSGATEANNMILSNYKDAEIFISATEHASVSYCCDLFEKVKVIKVDDNGIVDFNDLEEKLSNSTSPKKLVSIIYANNETGVLNPLKQISTIAHKYGAQIHSDCVQAVGKIEINLTELGIDFASISGHKFGAPLGTGALLAKNEFTLKPLICGGGQEKGFRSGTENVTAIAGLGVASKIMKDTGNNSNILKMRNKMETILLSEIDGLKIVGNKVNRLPNTSLLVNPKKTSEILLIALDMKGIAVSSGAACSSGKVGKSKVLEAMGYDDDQAKSAIRVSLGRNNTEEEIDYFIKTYIELSK
ncbi:MAG: cysteine desulfurase [Rickettsiales bacterium]|nr:cysteine desulfurase [Rickettsiales bacterium]MCA0253937.1 cysteine desulfurase [Pseudomonadota bacterium]